MPDTNSIPSPEKVTEEVKEATKEAASDFIHSLRALIAGGVGGICAVLTGHPFDLVKVRLQTAEKGVHSGAMDVVRKIMAQRGPLVCKSRKQYVRMDWANETTGSVRRSHSTIIRCHTDVCDKLLGLRCRKTARQALLNRPQRSVQHSPDLGRRILQRHTHDGCHSANGTSKSVTADPRAEEARA